MISILDLHLKISVSWLQLHLHGINELEFAENPTLWLCAMMYLNENILI